MKKVLFVATVPNHIICFHLPYLKWFKEIGFETHVAVNGTVNIPYCDVQYNFPIQRSPFNLKNLGALFILRKIINKNKFSLIHLHTPMGGVIGRIAAKNQRKKGSKVLYTAHGFHFYKGAPKLNWILYFPVEKYLSRFTDAIITINKEDFELIKNRNFSTKNVFLINGVGVNSARFRKATNEEKMQLRSKHGFHQAAFILIYVAEFIERKNHTFLLENLKILQNEIPDLMVIFAGRGKLLNKIQKLADKNGLKKYVIFVGFRNDIEEFIALSDVGVSVSKQEGFGINLVEEMFCGLPVVASQNRGHKEIVMHGINGYLFPLNNKNLFQEYILKLYSNKELRFELGTNASLSVNKFSLNNSLDTMKKIYTAYI